MTTRILPPEDWHLVAHLDVATWLPFMTPETARIVVIEEGSEIVGCWGVFRAVHLEGVWLKPEYRTRPRAVIALKTAAMDAAAEWGAWALTGSASEHVTRLIEKLGGQRIPMDTYAVPVRKTCQQP